jgi:hypothetical protein
MQSTPTCEPDAAGLAKRRRERRPPKLPKYILPTRANLDGRTAAAKLFEKLAGEIAADLGGESELTTIERALIEGFCGAAVILNAMNVKLALGQEIDLAEHAAAASSMVRIAAKLGLARRTRDVTSGVGQGEPAQEPWSVSLRNRLSTTTITTAAEEMEDAGAE